MSDIHGHLDTFNRIFSSIQEKVEQGYLLILLGDYVGYCPKSLEMLDRVIELDAKYPSIHVLKGNWERMLYDAAFDPNGQKAYQAMKKRGAADIVDKLRNDRAKRLIRKEALQSMKTHLQIGEYFFAHTGVNLEKWVEGNTWEDFLSRQTEDDLIENRMFYNQIEEYTARALVGKDHEAYSSIIEEIPYHIITGHAPVNRINPKNKELTPLPFVRGPVIGVDFAASSRKHVGLLQLQPYFSLYLEKI